MKSPTRPTRGSAEPGASHPGVPPLSDASPPTLEVRGVEKTFGTIRAVRGVSFEARAGQVTALLGPNGAGKTSLLRMVIGMLRPDRGSLVYRLGDSSNTASSSNTAASSHPAPAARPDPMRIGYLPEERGLYLDVPVRRMLLYFAALRGMPAAAARSAAEAWLARFDLADRAGAEVRDLSKGNQQKVQFISAILHRPALAVLDEPFSGLDPVNQDFFLELIRELAAGGTAVLLSAHQMQLVERLADQVILMRAGEAVSSGTLDQLRARWATGRALRLRLANPLDPATLATLAGTPGVREATSLAPDEVSLVLEPEASLRPLFSVLSRDAEVRELESETLTLHDLYLRTVTSAGGKEAP